MSQSPSREETLFSEALARPPKDRAAFLAAACAGDRALLARLIALVAAHDSPSSLLETPPTLTPTLKQEEKPGDRIGRYRLLQKLGEGGCGVVWMAEQTDPVRRRVALKVIKLGMDTRAVIARFEAERQALAMMDHPNIAKVLDGGSTRSGRPFFVMELFRGIPITRYCDENHLTPGDRLSLFITICHAVQHAHHRGIIHRDLKPSNILVSAQDGPPTPKIIDFGIAKATQGRLTNATLFTAFEMFIGTPAYMSPEQAEMSGVDVDARSDIYSLGVLLYELMTGQPPFDPHAFAQAGVDQIRQHIREIEPPTPSRRLHTLGEAERTSIARLRNMAPAHLALLLRGDIDWIIMRCLEKNRARRYDTAQALAADIERHLRHQPVSARPPSAAYRLRKYARRHRVGLGAAGLCLVALAAGVVLSRWHAARAEAEAAAAAAWDASAPAPAPRTGAASIAVLPFKNLGGDRKGDYFSEGISRELVDVLAKVPNLRVAATTPSSFNSKANLPRAAIARELGVTYIAAGTVRATPERVQIQIELLHAPTNSKVWSATLADEPRNILGLQVAIARDIARQLELKLDDTARATRTVNPAAHRLVLEGRHHWNLRTEEGYSRAEVAFTRAKELDPQFGDSYAGLACVYVIRANYREFEGSREPATALARAREEARRAIELDPTGAPAHAALGYVAMLEGALAEAEGHFQKALALNPSSAAIHCWYALLQANRGNLDASLAAYARASELEPLWFINLHRQSWHLTRARQLDEALRLNERAASLHPGIHIPNRADRAVILLELGRITEAADAARVVLQQPEQEPRWQADSDVIWVLRQAGFEAEAKEHAERVLARLPAESFNRGFVLGALGRFDEALPYLERLAVSPARGLFWDRMWDPWRDDPRFRQLLVKLGRLEDYDIARATRARLLKPTAPQTDAK